jgi:hypothetical protein
VDASGADPRIGRVRRYLRPRVRRN